MRAPGRRLSYAVAGFVMLALGLALALTQTGQARAVEGVDVAVSFDDLRPGETRADGGTYELARDARLVEFAWTERDGILRDAEIAVEACDATGGCHDATRADGAAFPAGAVRITLTVTLADDVAPDARGVATGRLTFVADDELAVTGGTVSDALLWGVALTLSGAAVLAAATAARRRRVATDPTPED